MKRIIVNTKSNENIIYIISDKYIKDCDKQHIFFDKSRLVKYLQTSTYISILLNTTKSIFDDKSIESTETLLSDGYWIWSADLNHYTKYHNFIWPKDFTNNIQSNQFKQSKISDGLHSFLELLTLDIDRTVFKEKSANLPVLNNFPVQNYELQEL